MRAIAQIVHSSFRRVENAADWLTGRAGPVFVAICLILVGGGVWTFFTTMFLELAPVPTELANLFHTYSPAHISLGLVPTLFDSTLKDPIATLRFFSWLLFCLFIVYSIAWHYYMACTVPPGSVSEGLGDSVPERRSGPGSHIWWARYRSRAAKASGPKLHHLSSADSHVMAHGQPEAAAPVRVSSVADLNKLNQALDGLDSNRARSASLSAALKPSPSVNASFSSSHRSSSSSETGTPRNYPRSDLPLSIHDVTPSLATTPARLDPEPSTNSYFARGTRQSQESIERDSTAAAPAAEPLAEVEIDEDDEDLFPLAGMCHKCPKIPLVKALSVLPPELRKIEKQLRTNKPSQTFTSKLSSEDVDEGEAEVRRWLGDAASEKLVAPPKPERSHHCRACKSCALKFDHHCPWLNQCVGLGNERYFVLFMAWLSFGCGIVVYSGYGVARRSLSWSVQWNYPYTPRVMVMLLFILALVMGFALAVMAGWQMIMVSRGETSVESQDNAHYRELASRRGQEFINVYDVGWRRNIELFFNVGPGSPYRWYTILLPIRVPPYSDGWHFAKRRGLNGKHAGIELQEQLTDEEFEDEHYEADQKAAGKGKGKDAATKASS
ncbi:Zinc finger, DHHC-type, palmitoyltransferase [Kalmanozyma brasiliensis GHG001]|uniref:Palmitoyltransferase n=1 Tax=Kalmanozyma brasiliensis (strain GHG001) TaxID=1365824 RepID=V5E3R7_KALBG|nr:Zinc finger, DHHC-type, palmitoyltransferase [Kalmanozyma brasiliensis GHG001]EST04826.1 Zinc finger, DHHC-type, palmitoyltransferase [Kalmanozyma brasiliensis GHG001]